MKKIELTPMELELRDKESLYDAENEFCDKVWYYRCHLAMREELKNGELKLVKKWKPEYSGKNFIAEKDWKRCLKAGKRVEKKYGKKNLGPYDDFDWGMINGKLSAIRWMLGDDWDRLDT
jgi:hypothetical protein